MQCGLKVTEGWDCRSQVINVSNILFSPSLLDLLFYIFPGVFWHLNLIKCRLSKSQMSLIQNKLLEPPPMNTFHPETLIKPSTSISLVLSRILFLPPWANALRIHSQYSSFSLCKCSNAHRLYPSPQSLLPSLPQCWRTVTLWFSKDLLHSAFYHQSQVMLWLIICQFMS